MDRLAPSELILNKDGSIYHLNLHPEQISDLIFLVGDPGRVSRVSSHFDKIDHRIEKREFITHTGWYKGQKFTVLSTGIGTDNIDIVVNELDALANIDLQERKYQDNHRQLTLIRMGTSGALQKDIPPGEIIVSSHAIGMDGLMHFYQRNNDTDGMLLEDAFTEYCDEHKLYLPIRPYGSKGTVALSHRYFSQWTSGITLTATGFYAPQSRKLRASIRTEGFLDGITDFSFQGYRITNMEMETAAIYGLATELGHRSLSINAILGNRIEGSFASDPHKVVDNMIREVLEALTRES